MTSTRPDRSADISSEPAQVGASGILGFEERLTREILRSERTRMLILAGLSGWLVVTFPVYALRSGIFGTAWALQVVAVFVLLASYELVIRQVVGRRLEQGKTLPRRLRFLNALVETSVPSCLILLGSRQVDPVYPLESAAAHMYPVFIVLSTLRLDFRLSVFTGCVAAVEYVILSFALVGGSEVAAGTLFSLPPFHLAKGVMLVLAGFAAGFVADQIKRPRHERVSGAGGAPAHRQRIRATGVARNRGGVAEARSGDPEQTHVRLRAVHGHPRLHASGGKEDARGLRRVSEFGVRRGDRDRGPEPWRDQPVPRRRLHGDVRRAGLHRPRLPKRVDGGARASRGGEDAFRLRPHPADDHRHRAARRRGGLGEYRLAGAAAVFDQRQRGDSRRAHRTAQQGIRLAAPGLGRGPARSGRE